MKKSLLLLSSLFVLSGINVANAQDDNSARIAEIEAQIKELQSELKELKGDDDGKEFTIGDEVEVGEYVVKIVKAEYTDERNSLEEAQPEEVLLLTFELTNNSEEDLTYTDNDFKVYVDGKELASYPLVYALGNVTPGRTVEAQSAYAIPERTDVEIEWEPTMNWDNLRALWKLTNEEIESE